MKTFTVAALATLMAAVTQAAPAASTPKEARVFYASLTFTGAGPNPPSYSLSEPADSSEFLIDNPLSVSHISSVGGAICTITGLDGSTTTIVGEQTVDVGPPQTQVRGSCDIL
ncbi:hypothetical protein ACLMJK_004703 [Lecanora helva]